MKQTLTEHPLKVIAVGSLTLGFMVVLVFVASSLIQGDGSLGTHFVMLPAGLIGSSLAVALFLVSPVLLTLYNLFYLIVPRSFPDLASPSRAVELTTICLGTLFTLLYSQLTEIQWAANWTEQLVNSQLHTPVATRSIPTLVVIAVVMVAGYLALRGKDVNAIPPLVAVLSIAGLYLGAVLCVVWSIQIAKHEWLLCVFPCNLVLIAAKVIKESILQWRPEEHPLPQGKPAILWIYGFLSRAGNWPWLAFLLTIPLTGILLAVLTLLGQAPDSFIQAWTQTSDWTFSQQTAPPNVYQDMHYLCTVAAGGHRRVVKPLREGVRHGHKVLVNRQLCIANAFEQLLQERTPRFHRVLRHIYDRYGYPVARHIRSAYAADAVYLVMKPLEWCFLTVLYLVDRRPENRIAVQYPHRPLPKPPEE